MTTTGTTWDNLKLSFAGATEIINEIFLPTNCTNGHEGNAIREWRPGRSHELSLMQGGLYLHVLWRSATSSRFSAALGIARTSSTLRSLARKFQAHSPHLAYPGTAYPVTIASLCSATSSRFSAALGIARTSSALRSLARKFQARFITLPFCQRIAGRLYAFFYP